MDNSTQKSELLIRYLDGEMSEAERKEFENQIAADLSLQGELESLRLAKKAVQSFGLKEQIAAVHSSILNEAAKQAPVIKTTPLRRVIRYCVSIAASILLIITSYWIFKFYTLSPDKMYASNYIAYELPTPRDTDSIPPSAFEKAYRASDYKEVIRLSNVSGLSIKEIFLTGISFLETEEIAKAISSFQVVIAEVGKTGIRNLREEAEYYLALAYLKNRDYDQALGLMIGIQEDPNHTYHDKFSRSFIRDVKILKWR